MSTATVNPLVWEDLEEDLDAPSTVDMFEAARN